MAQRALDKRCKGVGPGGLHCPCCRDYASIKRSLIALKRKYRRRANQKLKVDLIAILTTL